MVIERNLVIKWQKVDPNRKRAPHTRPSSITTTVTINFTTKYCPSTSTSTGGSGGIGNSGSSGTSPYSNVFVSSKLFKQHEFNIDSFGFISIDES